MEKMDIEYLKQAIKDNCKWLDINFDIDGDDIPEYVENFADENNYALRFYGHGKEYDMKGKLKHDDNMKTLMFSVDKGILKNKRDSESMKLQHIPSYNSVIVSGDRFITQELEIHPMSNYNPSFYSDINYYKDDSSLKTDKQLIDDMKQLRKDAKEISENLMNFNINAVGLKATNINRKFMFDNIGMLKCEHINLAERNIIDDTTIGPTLYGDKKKVTGYFMYDINSSYPSIYASKTFKMPIKAGSLQTVKKVSGYGMYKIELLNPRKINYKLFKTNSNSNWYTHIDIKLLDHLNYEYKLVKCENNAYIYEEDALIKTNVFLGKYVKALYELKRGGNKLAKSCMNSIWGKLCQEKTSTIELTEENLEAFDKTILQIHPIKGTMEVIDEKSPFKTAFARLKPFLIAQGRYKLAKVNHEVIKEGYDVCRVHTDSIMCNMPPQEFETIANISSEIGEWKLESKIDPECVYQVRNCLFVDLIE